MTSKNEVEVPQEEQVETRLTERFVEFSRLVEQNLPLFREKVEDLSKNELKRVLNAVIEFPVERTVEIKHPKEAKVVELGVQLKQAMSEMAIEALEMEKQRLIEEKENEEANEENKEQNNGKSEE